jgi:hypothetical protein
MEYYQLADLLKKVKKIVFGNFYSFLGNLEKKIVYKNDSLDGEYLVYYEDQSVNTKGHYKNGLKQVNGYGIFQMEKPK